MIGLCEKRRKKKASWLTRHVGEKKKSFISIRGEKKKRAAHVNPKEKSGRPAGEQNVKKGGDYVVFTARQEKKYWVFFSKKKDRSFAAILVH